VPVFARLEQWIRGPSGMHKYIALLAQLAGIWTCTGAQEASILGPAHPTRATFSIAAGESWLKVHFAESKTRDVPVPEVDDERWGYDEAAGRYVRFLFDNFGGFGRAESAGLQEGKLVWTGEYQLEGEKLAFRETFTLRERTLADVFELNQGGQWKQVASATCKRK